MGRLRDLCDYGRWRNSFLRQTGDRRVDRRWRADGLRDFHRAGAEYPRLYGNGLIEPYAKLGAGFSRYVSSSWSIGAKVSWCFMPEFHLGTYSSLNSYANFLEFSVGAVYHF